MQFNTRNNRTAFFVFMLGMIGLCVLGCGKSNEDDAPNGQTAEKAAVADEGYDLLDRLDLDRWLHTGCGQWDEGVLVLGADGSEAQMAFPRVLPDEYELTLEGVASSGQLTLYAQSTRYDTLLPFPVWVSDSAPISSASVQPGKPFQIQVRMWRHHVLITVNSRIYVAHAGDVDDLLEPIEPRTNGRTPTTLSIRNGSLRITRFHARDLAGERPNFMPRTRTSPAKLGVPWPTDREYWITRPTRQFPMGKSWNVCELSHEKTDQGIRLHVTKIQGSRAYLVHRGLLGGDFRVTMSFRNELSSTPPRDENASLRFGFLRAQEDINFKGLNLEFPDPRDAEHELDIRRTNGEVVVYFDGKTNPVGHLLNFEGDGYFGVEVRNGTCLHIKSLRVRTEGGLQTPLPPEEAPEAETLASDTSETVPAGKIAASTNSKPAAPKAEVESAQIGDSVQEIDLPGNVFDTALGADGRMLLLLTHETVAEEADDPSLKQGQVRFSPSAPGKWRLVYFDMITRRVVIKVDARSHVRGAAYAADPALDLPSHVDAVSYPPRLAAGLSHAVVAWPLERTMVTWDLQTHRQVAVKTLPCKGPLVDLALGSASEGPMLVTWRNAFHSQAELDARVFDPATLQYISDDIFLQAPSPGGQLEEETEEANVAKIASSPSWINVPVPLKSDAKLLGPYSASRDSLLFLPKSTYRAMVIRGRSFGTQAIGVGGFYHGLDSVAGAGLLQPFHSSVGITDGRSLLVRTASLPGRGDFLTLPTTSESIAMRVAMKRDRDTKIDAGMVSLWVLGQPVPFVTFTDFDISNETRLGYFNDDAQLPLARQVYCNPSAGTLISLAPREARRSTRGLGYPPRLLVKSFSLDELLTKPATGPPVVISSPPCVLDSAEAMEYRIQLQASTDKPSFQLIAGPEGMDVSSDSVVRWSAPQLEQDIYLPVSIAIGASPSTADYYHNFVLRVRADNTGSGKPLLSPVPARTREIAVRAAAIPNDGASQSSITLPCPYESVAWGNAGRYVCFWCPNLNAVFVADTKQRMLVRTIDVGTLAPQADAIVAASDKYLFFIDRETQQYQRWAFQSWSKTKEGRLDFPGQIIHALAGSASSGPLLLVGQDTENRPPSTVAALIDTDSFDVVCDFADDSQAKWDLSDFPEDLRVSSDGRRFLASRGFADRLMVNVAAIPDGDDVRYDVTTERAPKVNDLGATSNILFTAEGATDSRLQLFGSRADPPNRSHDGQGRVPALAGPFFLDVAHGGQIDHRQDVSIDVKYVGSTERLRQVQTDFGIVPAVRERSERYEFERFQLATDAGRVAFLPPSNRELVLFDVEPYDRLKSTGSAAVIVAEPPPDCAVAGSQFRFTPKFFGSDAPTEVTVEQGPTGMRVEDGKDLFWSVPQDAADAKALVVLSYHGPGTDLQYLSFDLNVVKNLAGTSKAAVSVAQRRSKPDPTTTELATVGAAKEIDWYDDLRKAPKMDTRTKTMRLPAVAHRVCLGGRGRFLIAHLPAIRRLAVVDLIECRIHGFVPLQDEQVAFAAGIRKLYVAQSKCRLITRWDLETLRCEQFRALEEGRRVINLAMGHCSHQPLYVSDSLGEHLKHTLNRLRTIRCIDVDTLRSAALPENGSQLVGVNGPGFRAPRPVLSQGSIRRGPTAIVASANGRLVFNATRTLRFSQENVVKYESPIPLDRALLGSDGQTVFIRRGSVQLDWQLVPQRDYGEPHELAWFVPSATQRFGLRFARRDGFDQAIDNPVMELLAFDVDGPLRRVEDVLVDAGMEYPKTSPAFLPNRRIVYLPDAGRIAFLRPNHVDLCVLRFDWTGEGQAVAEDYLLVASTPPKYRLEPGESFEYSLEIHATNGPVDVTGVVKPDGMEISPQGEITWNVPSDHPRQIEPVALKITDAAGRTLTHTFDVEVYRERPRGDLVSDPVPEQAGKVVSLAAEALATFDPPRDAEEGMAWKTMTLPTLATIRQTAIGGDRRYLVIVMPSVRAIGVIDIQALIAGAAVRQAARRLGTDSEDVSVAAGLEDLYVSDGSTIRRYDFALLELQAEQSLPKPWRSMAAPRGVVGPLCVVENAVAEEGGRPPESGKHFMCRLYDAKSLELLSARQAADSNVPSPPAAERDGGAVGRVTGGELLSAADQEPELSENAPAGHMANWATKIPCRHFRTSTPRYNVGGWLGSRDVVASGAVPGRVCVGTDSQTVLNSDHHAKAMLFFEQAEDDAICVWPELRLPGTVPVNPRPGGNAPRYSALGDSVSIVGWEGRFGFPIPSSDERPYPASAPSLEKQGIIVSAEGDSKSFLGTITADVYTVADDQPVANLPNVPYPLYHRLGDLPTMPISDRIRFFPQRGCVLTVPYINRAVVFHRVDLAAAIGDSGDGLFVSSVPHPIARRRTEYTYALQIHSRRGGVLMKLDEAPSDATLSTDGVFHWKVPATGGSERRQVVIHLTDRSGAARSHAFELFVLGAETEDHQ